MRDRPGWRDLATEEAQREFADGQARLDHGLNNLTTEAGRAQETADRRFTDWYDANVLNPAQDEFERNCVEAEFAARWPEPDDGARVEFEANGGTLYAAYREDVPEHGGGSWWLYGSDERLTWRDLVTQFNINMGDVQLLAAAAPDPRTER